MMRKSKVISIRPLPRVGAGVAGVVAVDPVANPPPVVAVGQLGKCLPCPLERSLVAECQTGGT